MARHAGGTQNKLARMPSGLSWDQVSAGLTCAVSRELKPGWAWECLLYYPSSTYESNILLKTTEFNQNSE